MPSLRYVVSLVMLAFVASFATAQSSRHVFLTAQQCKDEYEAAYKRMMQSLKDVNRCHDTAGIKACEPVRKQNGAAEREWLELGKTCSAMERQARQQRDQERAARKKEESEQQQANNGRPARTIIPMDQIAGQRESDGRPKVTIIPLPQQSSASQSDPVSAAIRDTAREVAKNIIVDSLPEWVGELLGGDEPSFSPELERAEEATDKFKGILQEHAMPGGSGAAAKRVQDAAIPVIRDRHRKLEGELGDFASSEAGRNIVDGGSRSTAPAYRPPPVASAPAHSNPFNEPGQHTPARTPTSAGDRIPTILPQKSSETEWQPTTHSGWQPVHKEPDSTYKRPAPSSQNPWGNGSEASPTVVAQNGADGASSVSGGSVSACDLVRRGEVQFRYKWKDKNGNQCYSNTSNGHSAAVCCR